MSTRCRIAMKLDNGCYRSVYCHFDGYPDGVGMTLRQHHQSPAQAHLVISKGDLSYISEVAISAYKDRGEKWEDVQPIESPNLEHLITVSRNDSAAYLYLFEDKLWRMMILNKADYA